jgi:hypothetical protein
MCVLIALHMCPHATTCVPSYNYMCAIIQLNVCPHTTTCASSYHYMCVLIPLHMCPHTTTCVSSYNYICVLMQHVCPHTTYVSSAPNTRFFNFAVQKYKYWRSCWYKSTNTDAAVGRSATHTHTHTHTYTHTHTHKHIHTQLRVESTHAIQKNLSKRIEILRRLTGYATSVSGLQLLVYQAFSY